MEEKNESKNDEPSLKERYQLLVNARNFHYDNFSKWASYFYIAIGAFFVAYYTVASSQNIEQREKQFLSILILIIGFLCSILWYWSVKGYYYWNINFISLVNHYEVNLFKWPKEKRVYSVFANKEVQNNYSSPIHGANISTSKVAILFSYIITITWGFLLFYKLFSLLCCINCEWLIILGSSLLSIFMVLLASVTFAKYGLYSKHDHFPDLHIKQNKIK